MKKIVFYSYLKCSTCRKAAKWLKSKDFEFQLIDIVKEPPLVNYLNLALEQYSDDKKRIFNTRGKAFKITIKNYFFQFDLLIFDFLSTLKFFFFRGIQLFNKF